MGALERVAHTFPADVTTNELLPMLFAYPFFLALLAKINYSLTLKLVFSSLTKE
jgi:hypothetical protein